MRAFVKFCKELKPKVAIMNGDVTDFPQISRHPPIGWEDHPTVADEVQAAQAQLAKVEAARVSSSSVIPAPLLMWC